MSLQQFLLFVALPVVFFKPFFGYLFMPPGWKPDGDGETTEDLRRRARLIPLRSA